MQETSSECIFRVDFTLFTSIFVPQGSEISRTLMLNVFAIFTSRSPYAPLLRIKIFFPGGTTEVITASTTAVPDPPKRTVV